MFLYVTVYRYAWLVKVCHYKHQEYNHTAERHYPVCSNSLISKSAFEFLQPFWVILAVSRINLSIAGFCNHLLIPAKIALESCCLSYFICTLALLSAFSVIWQYELWAVCFNCSHLHGFGLVLLPGFPDHCEISTSCSSVLGIIVLLLSLLPHQFGEPSVTSHFQA